MYFKIHLKNTLGAFQYFLLHFNEVNTNVCSRTNNSGAKTLNFNILDPSGKTN